MGRKYKKPLKNCEGCKRLNHIINNEGVKTYYCTIYIEQNCFMSQCEKKIVISKEDEIKE